MSAPEPWRIVSRLSWASARASLTFCAVAVAVCLGPARPPSAVAQAPTTVRIELERDDIAAGDAVDAYVYVENAVNLAGFDTVVTYDERFLSLQIAEIGTAFLQSGGRIVVPLGPTRQPGVVALGAVTLPGTGDLGASGAGDLAVLTFRAHAAGETIVGLGKVDIVDVAGARLQIDGESATVRIGRGSGPTPTAGGPSPLPEHLFLPWIGRRG